MKMVNVSADLTISWPEDADGCRISGHKPTAYEEIEDAIERGEERLRLLREARERVFRLTQMEKKA